MIWTIAAEDGVRIGDWEIASTVAEFIEAIAIVVIVVGVVAACGAGILMTAQSGITDGVSRFKVVIARALLVGLDLLIAADVIKTVTLEGTLESALVLGLLVVIRTFLSWALILELTGKWPWQQPGEESEAP